MPAPSAPAPPPRPSPGADRLRILHVYNRLDPRDGGPPQMIAALAQAQQALGHGITLVSSDPPDAPATRRFLAEVLDPVPPRTTIPARLPVATPAERAALSALVRAHDVVHVHGVWAVPGLLAGRTCRALGVPYVLTAHGMLHPEALAQRRLKKLVGLWALGYRRHVAGAAAIHFLNPVEKARARGVPLPPRTAVIPNGIFPEAFAEARLPPRGRFRATLPAVGDAPFVLYLARLHRQKGPDLLAEAFAVVARERPDVHLVVAGPDQGARADLAARVARHGLQARVHLLGPIYGDEKLALLRDAAVYCLPSRQEGFSVGITEALAIGTPCVVTETCNFPEVAEADCGRVTRLDPADIGRGLLEVLADPAAAAAMGERGRRLVSSRFTWPNIAERMLALYREVLTSGPVLR